MKKQLKLVTLVLAIALLAVCATLLSFAEEGAEPQPSFTVYGADGNPTGVSGSTFEEIRALASSLSDGDTVVLGTDMEASNALYFASTEDAPRTINFDLNGHKIYTTRKITPGLINVGSYTTVNVYSSVEGGVLYCANLLESGTSGCVFNVRGKSAVLNVGDFTDGEVTYPGENFATYSAALIDIVIDSATIEACDAECRFNVTGGSYYSIHTDYSGYIIPRGGDIVMNLTDANIISMETKPPINSAGANTVLNMTNCRIFQYQSQPIALFNSALGTVNMKDCITTYSMKCSQSAQGEGVVHLSGKNVFAIAAQGDYYNTLIADFENKTDVTTYSSFELARGGKELVYYDNTANFNRVLTSPVPTLAYPKTFVDQEDVVTYKFVKAGDSLTQTWSKYETPEVPYELPVGGESGVYKYGWQKSVADDGTIIYKIGLVADYNLKIVAVWENDEVYFKVLIPAAVIDGDHIDFVNTSIHGESCPANYWEPITVDGKDYYYAVTGVIYPEYADEVIRIRIPCEYGSGVNVDTVWSFTLADYIEKVLATESEGKWSEEQYNVIKEIKAAYFPETDGADEV